MSSAPVYLPVPTGVKLHYAPPMPPPPLHTPTPTAWDSEDIDHWKIVDIKPGDMSGPLLEESSFATLFPRYREKYLQQVWPHVKRTLKDLVNGVMSPITDNVVMFPSLSGCGVPAGSH